MSTGVIIVLSALVFLLVLFSAFFSACETAMTTASKARMHALAKEGNRRAALINRLREHKDRLIGAVLLGNNLVNILSSALATSILIHLFGQAGVVYATFGMTILILVFAEVLPKTYALHRADSMAMAMAPAVKIIVAVFSPVTIAVARIVRITLRLFGVDISVKPAGDYTEVLRGTIELHRGPEEETQEQRAMLHSILDLADVDVGRIMTHRKNVETIDANMPMAQIIADMLKSQFTRLPVWKDTPDNIIGVVHAKALLKEIQAHGGKIDRVSLDMIASDPWFVPDTTTLFDQLQEFRKRREHFALVVDEYGTLMGVVTLEDILEEIVGEIEDEMDETVAGVRKQPNGTYIVNGDVPVRDLNREFEWRLPDKEYSTIAGLILHESQMVPEPGQSFHFFGFRFDIMRRQRNQITLVRVTPPKKDEKKTAA